jgi:hypothetical protein
MIPATFPDAQIEPLPKIRRKGENNRDAKSIPKQTDLTVPVSE